MVTSRHIRHLRLFRAHPATVLALLLFVLLLILLSTLIARQHKEDAIRTAMKLTDNRAHSESECFSSLRSLEAAFPSPVSGERIDVYVIDVPFLHKLRTNCSAEVTKPLSVMAHDRFRIVELEKVYGDRLNITYFVEGTDFFMLKTRMPTALMKYAVHRVAGFLLPLDIWRFESFMARSRLLECRNMTVKRDTTQERVMPLSFVDKMAEFRDEVIDMGAMPFITGGSLLGWYRECSIIPHTSDVDFAILYTDFKPAMKEQLKTLKSFDLYKRSGQDHKSLEFTLVAKTKGPVDLFVMYAEDDEHIYTAGADASVRSKYKWILPKIDEFCAGILLGRLFFVPCNAEKLIQAEYGKNWTVDHPTKDFNWWESNSNVVQDGYYTEEEMKKYFIIYY